MNIEDTEEEVQSETIHHGRGRRRMAAPTVTGRSPEYYNWIPLTSGNHEIIITMKIHTNSYISIIDDEAPPARQFSEEVGFHIPPDCEEPADFFGLFFNDGTWDFLVENTNSYAAMKLSEMEVCILNVI